MVRLELGSCLKCGSNYIPCSSLHLVECLEVSCLVPDSIVITADRCGMAPFRPRQPNAFLRIFLAAEPHRSPYSLADQGLDRAALHNGEGMAVAVAHRFPGTSWHYMSEL